MSFDLLICLTCCFIEHPPISGSHSEAGRASRKPTRGRLGVRSEPIRIRLPQNLACSSCRNCPTVHRLQRLLEPLSLGPPYPGSVRCIRPSFQRRPGFWQTWRSRLAEPGRRSGPSPAGRQRRSRPPSGPARASACRCPRKAGGTMLLRYI